MQARTGRPSRAPELRPAPIPWPLGRAERKRCGVSSPAGRPKRPPRIRLIEPPVEAKNRVLRHVAASSPRTVPRLEEALSLHDECVSRGGSAAPDLALEADAGLVALALRSRHFQARNVSLYVSS